MEKDLDLSWFDLSKYDDISGFTLIEWRTELCRRVGFKVLGRLFNVQYLCSEDEDHELYPSINDTPHNAKEVNAKFKDDFYEGLKKEPIYKNYSLELDHFLFQDRVAIQEEAIMPATWDDVSMGSEDIKFLKDLIATNEKINSFSILDMETDEYEVLDASYNYDELRRRPLKHDQELKVSGSSLVSINFNAPTEVLMKQFKEFISIEREERGNVMISEAKRADWVTMKILPCIDLLIYSEIEGKRISHNKLGQLLFPASSLGINDDFDVVDRVRRTVFGLIKKVLHPNTISMIEYQLEHDENNQK